jgi:DNA replication protein DnaC
MSYSDMERVFAKRESDAAEAVGLSIPEYRAKLVTDRVAYEISKEENETRKTFSDAGVPARAIEAAAGQVIVTVALKQSLRDDALVVLAGEPGRGKSVAACAWLMAGNCSVRWVSAGSLSRGIAYDEEAFQKLARVGRLVIDDVGTEYQDQKDRYLATFSELVDARFGNKRPTLLTTNLTAAVFKERYGERLASRINEDGAFIACGGPDLRRERGTTP